MGLQNEHEAAPNKVQGRVILKKLIGNIFFFPQVADDGAEDKESSTVSSATTVTSETTSGTSVTTTTTHISKVRTVI